MRAIEAIYLKNKLAGYMIIFICMYPSKYLPKIILSKDLFYEL